MKKNWEHAAGIIWPIMIKAANDNRKLFYSDIAPIISTNPLSVRYALSPVFEYCWNEDLPWLTGVVVDKTTKMPGKGFTRWMTNDYNYELQRIYGFDWNSVKNPFGKFSEDDSISKLAKKLLGDAENSEQVYKISNTRGMAQKIFRIALLEAYDYSCAICELSFENALEAAHIVPWGLATDHERCDPKNGILLCSNHHKLFDNGDLSISENYTVLYDDKDFINDDYSTSDIELLRPYIGKSISLPRQKQLKPLAEYLHRKAELLKEIAHNTSS